MPPGRFPGYCGISFFPKHSHPADIYPRMVPVDGFCHFFDSVDSAYHSNRGEPGRDRRGFCLHVHCLHSCGGHSGDPDKTPGMVYAMPDGESARKDRQDPKKRLESLLSLIALFFFNHSNETNETHV